MENFYKWMVVNIPKDDVEVWFNMNNIHYEKIELFKDIFKTLNRLILDTYLGFNSGETSIVMSSEDKLNHFEWCWNELISIFSKENVTILPLGDHKDYFISFYFDIFYESKVFDVLSIDNYIDDLFKIDKTFTKADLDILKDIYNVINLNILWNNH